MKIINRFPIVSKKVGRYTSFPTLIILGETVWMACRSGRVDPKLAHGGEGVVKLFSAHIEQLQNWEDHGIVFSPSPGGTVNELDAILSAPTEGVTFLATRDFKYKERNHTYLSCEPQPPFKTRRLLAEISEHRLICFGHIRMTKDGDLLMPGYWGEPAEPEGAPYVLVSQDDGESWQLRAKAASSKAVGTRLTEYSLSYLGTTNWIALIRSETPPYFLHKSVSIDDGRKWSPVEQTELMGHAPMLIETNRERNLLVLYRDLSQSAAGIGLGCSLDSGVSWKMLGRLADYTGSIYDGGYGDLVPLGNDLYLAAYYLCDQDASPWIEGCVFSIQ